MVLFPDGLLPLRIFEPRYLAMVSRCLKRSEPFVVALAVPGGEGGRVRAASTGTTARITDFGRGADGMLTLRTVGEQRVALDALRREPDGLQLGRAAPRADGAPATLGAADAALLAVLHELMPEDDPALRGMPRRWDDAGWVAWRGAEQLPLEPEARQRVLELDDVRARLDALRPVAVALGERR